MKKEISPAVTWIAVVVVVLLVVFFGYRMISGPPPDADKKGSDKNMQKVQNGGKLYEPPSGVMPTGGASSGKMSGFNMKPPGQ